MVIVYVRSSFLKKRKNRLSFSRLKSLVVEVGWIRWENYYEHILEHCEPCVTTTDYVWRIMVWPD